MKRVFMVTVLVAAVVLLTGTLAQAYSENFEGATWGQFLRDAPLNWTKLPGFTPDYVPDGKVVAEGTGLWPGNTGKYLDGSVSSGARKAYAHSPAVFATTGQVLLTFDFYAPSATTWSGFSVWYNEGISGGDGVGWYATGGGKLTFLNNFNPVNPQTLAGDFIGKTVHAQIGFDFTPGSHKTWGILDTDDGKHFATGDMPVTLETSKFALLNQLNYGEWYKNPGLSIDNIVLAQVPEPGSLLALATGLVGFVGLRRMRRS